MGLLKQLLSTLIDCYFCFSSDYGYYNDRENSKCIRDTSKPPELCLHGDVETDKLGSVLLVLRDPLRLHAFGMIPVKISDQDHSDPAWYIRGTDELTLEKDSSVSLM